MRADQASATRALGPALQLCMGLLAANAAAQVAIDQQVPPKPAQEADTPSTPVPMPVWRESPPLRGQSVVQPPRFASGAEPVVQIVVPVVLSEATYDRRALICDVKVTLRLAGLTTGSFVQGQVPLLMTWAEPVVLPIPRAAGLERADRTQCRQLSLQSQTTTTAPASQFER